MTLKRMVVLVLGVSTIVVYFLAANFDHAPVEDIAQSEKAAQLEPIAHVVSEEQVGRSVRIRNEGGRSSQESEATDSLSELEILAETLSANTKELMAIAQSRLMMRYYDEFYRMLEDDEATDHDLDAIAEKLVAASQEIEEKYLIYFEIGVPDYGVAKIAEESLGFVMQEIAPLVPNVQLSDIQASVRTGYIENIMRLMRESNISVASQELLREYLEASVGEDVLFVGAADVARLLGAERDIKYLEMAYADLSGKMNLHDASAYTQVMNRVLNIRHVSRNHIPFHLATRQSRGI